LANTFSTSQIIDEVKKVKLPFHRGFSDSDRVTKKMDKVELSRLFDLFESSEDDLCYESYGFKPLAVYWKNWDAPLVVLHSQNTPKAIALIKFNLK
jgi:hypothetical protein